MTYRKRNQYSVCRNQTRRNQTRHKQARRKQAKTRGGGGGRTSSSASRSSSSANRRRTSKPAAASIRPTRPTLTTIAQNLSKLCTPGVLADPVRFRTMLLDTVLGDVATPKDKRRVLADICKKLGCKQASSSASSSVSTHMMCETIRAKMGTTLSTRSIVVASILGLLTSMLAIGVGNRYIPGDAGDIPDDRLENIMYPYRNLPIPAGVAVATAGILAGNFANIAKSAFSTKPHTIRERMGSVIHSHSRPKHTKRRGGWLCEFCKQRIGGNKCTCVYESNLKSREIHANWLGFRTGGVTYTCKCHARTFTTRDDYKKHVPPPQPPPPPPPPPQPQPGVCKVLQCGTFGKTHDDTPDGRGGHYCDRCINCDSTHRAMDCPRTKCGIPAYWGWAKNAQTNKWELETWWEGAKTSQTGTYTFAPKQKDDGDAVPGDVRVLGTLSTTNQTRCQETVESDGPATKNATVQAAKANVNATIYDKLVHDFPLFSKNIGIHVGAVGHDIHYPPQKDRQCVFVLPSQLNAAEYRDPKNNYIVSEVNAYKLDPTGGPIGQLAADPGAAQFIINNAMNANRTDSINYISYISEMGTITGITLQNGYLKVTDADVNTFETNMEHMTVMGMSGLAVCGTLYNGKSHHLQLPKSHTVDLIYASAVPVGTYNNGRSETTLRIAELTIFAQYTAALRIAIANKNRHVYLLPLGGGVFGNGFNSIARAMNAAFRNLEGDLVEANCKVSVLAFKIPSPPYLGKIFEPDFFQNAHEGTPISGSSIGGEMCPTQVTVDATRKLLDGAAWPQDGFLSPHPDDRGCILLTTGAMNPVHLGHVAMLLAAAARLRAADYHVCGAYLSPSHDNYVQPKANNPDNPTIGLSAAFRLEAARRAVRGSGEDGGLPMAVSSWETNRAGYWPDYPEVCTAAVDNPNLKKYGKVFYVCGTDHEKKCGLDEVAPEGCGVVIVPRAGEVVPIEVPGTNNIFVAKAPTDAISTFSSTMLRKALKDNDESTVAQMVSPREEHFFFHPTPAEKEKYASDFAKLQPSLSITGRLSDFLRVYSFY
jgi:nicotinic acid mononucleotide adenylyltransferase